MLQHTEWPTIPVQLQAQSGRHAWLSPRSLANQHGPRARMRLKEQALLIARQNEYWEQHVLAMSEFKHARQSALTPGQRNHQEGLEQRSRLSPRAIQPRASSARPQRQPTHGPSMAYEARNSLQLKLDDANRRLEAVLYRLEQTSAGLPDARRHARTARAPSSPRAGAPRPVSAAHQPAPQPRADADSADRRAPAVRQPTRRRRPAKQPTLRDARTRAGGDDGAGASAAGCRRRRFAQGTAAAA